MLDTFMHDALSVLHQKKCMHLGNPQLQNLREVFERRDLQARLPRGAGIRAVVLDDAAEAATIARRPTRSPGRRAAPVDAAFVLFFQASKEPTCLPRLPDL